MLFKQEFLEEIANGNVRSAFRRWRRPTVKAGGTLLTPVGQLAIERVVPTPLNAITEQDARAAGYMDLATLVRELERRSAGDVYRIDFHLAGPDPRIALREQSEISDAAMAQLRTRLERLDRAGADRPWTARVLRAIADRPGVRAPDLAATFGQETQVFKRNVRKLKALGLTESLAVGYRLSPRGAVVLTALGTDDSG